jgi:hypothetical protein
VQLSTLLDEQNSPGRRSQHGDAGDVHRGDVRAMDHRFVFMLLFMSLSKVQPNADRL